MPFRLYTLTAIAFCNLDRDGSLVVIASRLALDWFVAEQLTHMFKGHT